MLAAGTSADDRCRSPDDRLIRAVVASQPYLAGSGKVLAQSLEIPRICAAEPVYGLVGVANDEEAGSLAGHELNQSILDGVDVLELVHQQVLGVLANPRQRLRVLFQQFEEFEQNIVEIAGAAAAKAMKDEVPA